jgi:hypothetical protein
MALPWTPEDRFPVRMPAGIRSAAILPKKRGRNQLVVLNSAAHLSSPKNVKN